MSNKLDIWDAYCMVGVALGLLAIIWATWEPPPEPKQILNQSQSHYALGSTFRPELESH